jgi:hypothetical protein
VLAILPRDAGGIGNAENESFDQRFVQQTGEDIYVASGTTRVGAVTVRVTATLRYARGEQRPVQVLAWSDSSPPVAAKPQASAHAP